MKRKITPLKNFEKTIKKLIEQHKLLPEDYEDFKESLAENPDLGDKIPGASSVKKARLKSASGGKRGGFRICYYYDVSDQEIFLILIYQKNEQENLSPAEKKDLKRIVELIEKE